jgi:hypothetical protein
MRLRPSSPYLAVAPVASTNHSASSAGSAGVSRLDQRAVIRFRRGRPSLPADRLGRELADPLDQEPFEVELLQVDERRLLREALVPQIERIDLVAARERPSDRPGDSLGADPVVDAEPVEDLEALLRIADAARRRAANADGVVLVEDDDGDAAQRQIARERQAGEAAAGDDDRVAPALARREVGRSDERPARQLVRRSEFPDLGGAHRPVVIASPRTRQSHRQPASADRPDRPGSGRRR